MGHLIGGDMDRDINGDDCVQHHCHRRKSCQGVLLGDLEWRGYTRPYTNMGGYEKLGVIGTGSYGTVYSAIKLSNNQRVAIKRMYTIRSNHAGILCLREMELSKLLSHPYISSPMEILHSSPFKTLSPRKGHRLDKMYLVMEEARTDMEQLLINGPFYSLAVMKKGMHQLAQAVAYLHSMGIVHRDLKPNNVLVFETSSTEVDFKLIDFGAAKPLNNRDKHTNDIIYIEYRAPEILLNGMEYGNEVDIWALGCIFFEMLTSKPPFACTKDTECSSHLKKILTALGLSLMDIRIAEERGILHQSTKGIKPLLRGCAYAKRACEYTRNYSKDIPTIKKYEDAFNTLSRDERDSLDSWVSLVDSMLNLDRTKRISAKGVLNHPFFHDQPIVSHPPPLRKRDIVIQIKDSPNRTETLKYLNMADLQPRGYYHAIDIVNRITLVRQDFNPKQLATVVASIVSKYWLLEKSPKTREIMDFKTPMTLNELADFELVIVRDVLDYVIYRGTLYDMVGKSIPDWWLRALSTSPNMDGKQIGHVVDAIEERMKKASPPSASTKRRTKVLRKLTCTS
jgi:serine/threonine protein kinase